VSPQPSSVKVPSAKPHEVPMQLIGLGTILTVSVAVVPVIY
jgi:hypothetical protein